MSHLLLIVCSGSQIKKFGHLSAWGFWSIRSQPIRGPHVSLLCLRQRSFVNLDAPEHRLGAVLMQAEGRGRGKKEKKTFCFPQQKVSIGNRDFLKERAVGQWWKPGYGLTSFSDILPGLIIQLWPSCTHVQHSRVWISKYITLIYLSYCLLPDLERLKNFLFLSWRGVE